jgi:hypothetical protein
MADIFREVEEDVRRDRALEFWKKYSSLLIALALVLVAATAGWRAFDYFERQKAEVAGARFEAAIEAAKAGETDKAATDFAALATDATSGYQRLARFREAAEIAKLDTDKGVKAYEALASDAGQTPLLRDLARLRGALLVADTADRDALKARLDPLLVAGNAWGPNAREMLGLAALKAGDYEAAGRFFDEIVTDKNAPPSLRQRADLLLAIVRSGPLKPAS